jgi:hypothetical protein
MISILTGTTEAADRICTNMTTSANTQITFIDIIARVAVYLKSISIEAVAAVISYVIRTTLLTQIE